MKVFHVLFIKREGYVFHDTSSSWCSILQEFLENSTNFEIFFQGSRKLQEKNLPVLWENAWSSVEKLQ